MQRFQFRSLALALLFALFFGLVGAGTALAVQTHMLNARADLNSALNELHQATANKGGHRNNAIRFINEAMTEVNLGIKYGQ